MTSLPCKCGKKPNTFFYEAGKVYIQCLRCQAQGPKANGLKHAIALWNKEVKK